MDPKIIRQLVGMGVDRPILSLRMVGARRVEVHCLGDYEPLVYLLPEAERVPASKAKKRVKPLYKMSKESLCELALDLGIQPHGMTKANLIAAIRDLEVY